MCGKAYRSTGSPDNSSDTVSLDGGLIGFKVLIRDHDEGHFICRQRAPVGLVLTIGVTLRLLDDDGPESSLK
jgi:hypothetical protein